MHKNILKKSLHVIILLLILHSISFAIVLEPLYKTIDDKNHKNILYTITNPSNEPVAVQVSVHQVISTNQKIE